MVAQNLDKIRTSTAKALAVSINSRGGTPVQCDLIIQKLHNFCHTHHIPLLTFAEDIAASGGYMILSAGDKVYADKTSIVGSIGVVMQKAQLRALAERFGVSMRRISSDK